MQLGNYTYCASLYRNIKYNKNFSLLFRNYRKANQVVRRLHFHFRLSFFNFSPLAGNHYYYLEKGTGIKFIFSFSQRFLYLFFSYDPVPHGSSPLARIQFQTHPKISSPWGPSRLLFLVEQQPCSSQQSCSNPVTAHLPTILPPGSRTPVASSRTRFQRNL